MPILTLQVAPLQSPERYSALAKSLTTLTEVVLKKRAAVTAVTIEDLPAARWYVGGEPVDEPTAHLEISITTGTNTAEQKAEFITQAYALLCEQLNGGQPLHLASYIIVREVAGTDWGFDGVTQAARLMARERELAAA
jgi:4-oxalocrotonate tautomerase